MPRSTKEHKVAKTYTLIKTKTGTNFAQPEDNLREEAITLVSYTVLSKLEFLNISLILLRMYIYGGSDIREGQLDTLWAFDLDKMGDLKELSDYSPGPDSHAALEWTKVETTGKSPGPISHHMTIVVDNKLLVIGGSFFKSNNT